MSDERELLRRAAGALREIRVEGGRDLITAGLVSGLKVSQEGRVRFRLRVPSDGPELVDRARGAVERVEGVEGVDIDVEDTGGGQVGRKLPMAEEAPEGPRPAGGRKLPLAGGATGAGGGGTSGPATRAAPPRPESIPGIARVVAVSSGKGGVGKSTVATNLAASLAAAGHRVGLLDADVYGPDIPIMFGVYGRPQVTPDERVVPLEAHGVKLMSIGFLLDEDAPAIWRGPIVMGIIRQFLQQVEWGELDYLFVDMPPGTGDAQLSLVQLVEVHGAVVVTTPQGVATADVLKAIKMFERVDVPVLGLVENMSGFSCPHCGERTEIFGEGGGRKLAATAAVEFLGAVPLGASVVGSGDAGRPTVIDAPESPEAKAFGAVAEAVAAALQAVGDDAAASTP